MVLVILSRTLNIRGNVVFNVKYLLDEIGIPYSKKDRVSRIINTINKMFDINLDNEVDINKLLFLSYNTEPSQYVVVSDREVNTILGYSKRVDKFNLFNTYITIKRFVNHKTGQAFPSINTIKNITNVVSNNTTANYISILEELGLLRCIRDNNHVVTQSGVRKRNNTYILC